MILQIRTIDEYTEDPFLLRVPFEDLGSFAAKMDALPSPPFGLIPPVTADLNRTARCMAIVRDFFPNHAIYAPIVRTPAREFIRAARSAGFTHFALPYVEPWKMFWEEISDLLLGKEIHVAGGDPGGGRWTWSEEGLV